MSATIRQYLNQFFEWIRPYDIWLFKKINQEWTASWADAFFPVLTDLHKTSWFFYILPLVICLILAKKFRIHTVTLVLTLGLCLGVSDWAGGKIKRTIPRERPFQSIQETAAVQKSPAANNTSFYSNHSSNNFAAAAFISFFMPVLSWLFFPIAFVVAYSRVYNGVHYPSDIIIGALMGILWGKAFSHFASRFITNELRARLLKEQQAENSVAMKKNLRPD